MNQKLKALRAAVSENFLAYLLGAVFVIGLGGVLVRGLFSLSPEAWSVNYWVQEILKAVAYGIGTLLFSLLAVAVYIDTRDSTRQDWRTVAIMVTGAASLIPLLYTPAMYLRGFVFLLFIFGVPAALGVREWYRDESRWLLPPFRR